VGVEADRGRGGSNWEVDARARGTRDWFAEAESLKVVLKWLSEEARCSAAVACWWPLDAAHTSLKIHHAERRREKERERRILYYFFITWKR